MESCKRNVIIPVEKREGDFGEGIASVVEVVRRGFVQNWTASECRDCVRSRGRCGFNETIYQFQCFCPNRPYYRSCSSTKENRLPLVLKITGCVSAVIVVTCLVIILLWSIRKTRKKSMEQKEMGLLLNKHGNLELQRYNYSQLKKMTNFFTQRLGKGGYGSVYKGMSQDGHLFAVKILDECKSTVQEFVNEVVSIGNTSHVNIVTLLGFCMEPSTRAIVYEFMPNSSLDKFIYSSSSLAESRLGWKKLLDIAVGIARGLEYLHHGCNTRILHLDIKPQNILLDKDFLPKISDFGLDKLCPERASIVSMSGMRGTIGYIAPEVFSRNFGGVSHKSDVYSYGMTILDIVGGRKNNGPTVDDSTSETYFPQWIYKDLAIMDVEGIVVGEDKEVGQSVKRKLLIIGLWCIQMDPKERPTMNRVVEMLESELESLHIPPYSCLSYSPNM